MSSGRWSVGRTPTGSPFGKKRTVISLTPEETRHRAEKCSRCQQPRSMHEGDGLKMDHNFVHAKTHFPADAGGWPFTDKAKD